MNFSHVIAEHARRRPSHLAIVAPEGRLTYEQLESRVRRLAAGLAARGIGVGDRVALLLPNGSTFLECYLAVLRVGGWCVPLNWRLAADELAYALDHSEARLLVLDERFAAAGFEAAARAGTPRVLATGAANGDGTEPYAALLDASPRAACEVVAMDAVQRVMYTSGTTDRPKGAMLTSGQVWWGCASRALDFGLTPADVGLVVGPLYHVGALDSYATVMLYLGATVVVLPKFDPEAVLDAIERERVTNCWLAPTMISMIFDAPGHERRDVSTLRVLLTGGEKASLPLLQQLHESWPRTGVYEAYGLTECQGIATFLPPSKALRKAGSVGTAAWMREVRVVDDEGQSAPPGVRGEIVVRGPLVFPGYLHDAAATAATLDGGWLRTGDIGLVDEEGDLHVVDRKKDMILSGGENVASSEIERIIHELPEVLEAAVVAMPDPRWGEVPAAFVVPRGGRRLNPDAVRAHCRERLAGFKVPARVDVVESLPRTSSGKVLKRRLRDQVGGGKA